MVSLTDGFVTALLDALGSPVRQAVSLRGGDVAASFRIDLDDGRRLFAKSHPSAPPGFFVTEATGLAWLREVDAVYVPDVVAVGDEPVPFLVLDWIDEGGRTSDRDRSFGRALAALHSSAAPTFGRVDRRTTGSRALPNEPAATWADFYASNRLLPLAAKARDASALPTTTIADLEGLANRLATLGVPDEPSARLHGDLWAGNRVVDTSGRSWLIDPAAHGGHREFDLAMMRLFGGFDDDCYAAYDEVHPLGPGWSERVALHQIAPLVVHAIKFGGGHVDAACDAISRYC